MTGATYFLQNGFDSHDGAEWGLWSESEESEVESSPRVSLRVPGLAAGRFHQQQK